MMQASSHCGDAEVDSTDMTLDSLVTAVPLPGVTWPAGEEVCRPLVLHFLGEPQQHTGVIVSGTGSVGRAAGTERRKRARLQETKQKKHRAYMHIFITGCFSRFNQPPLL